MGEVHKLLPVCRVIRTQGLGFTGNFWLITANHTWWWRQKVNNRHKEHVFLADGRCFGDENILQNYEIHECAQAQDESFDSWWNRAKAKAMEGALGEVSKNGETVQNSSDSSGDDLDVVVVKVEPPLINLVYQSVEEMWRQWVRPRVFSEIGLSPREFAQPAGTCRLSH